jgi:hypothetical protein
MRIPRSGGNLALGKRGVLVKSKRRLAAAFEATGVRLVENQ